MSLSGLAAIDWLASESTRDDPAASSHWREFHRDFKYSGAGFEGLMGFGGNDPPHRGLRGAFIRLLQWRFRRLGRDFPHFAEFDRCARDITRAQRRAHDIDVMRQSLSLALLASRTEALGPEKTACVIGDGFGSMTALLLATDSAARVILVNLHRTLLVDLWYLKLWMTSEVFDKSVSLARTAEEIEECCALTAPSGSRTRVVAVCAQDHRLLRTAPLDVALNMVSFQEMNPPRIGEYFDDLRAVADRRSLVLYCCNREEKQLPDGTVTRFSEYPWSLSDEVIVDELCPWHQEYYSVRPPFYRPYDGLIRHRMVVMSPNSLKYD